MRAARLFVLRLEARRPAAAHAARVLEPALRLAWARPARATAADKAVLLGLAGDEPDTVDVDAVPALLAAVRGEGGIALLGGVTRCAFTRTERPEASSAARRCLSTPTACASRLSMPAGAELASRVYYSVGGGFVVSDEVAADGAKQKVLAPDTTVLPHPFPQRRRAAQRCKAIHDGRAAASLR
jgi:L-serine dehydratase